MAGERVLSPRELNRALLARQGLLARERRPVLELVEHLVGLQAQVPSNPYIALWSRLEGFDPGELSTALEERRAVRAGLLRNTIHLVSARDCLAMQPHTQAVLRATFRSAFLKQLTADPDAVAADAAALLDGEPLTRKQVGELLAPRWPGEDPAVLGHAAAHHLALVHAPPRGLWQRSGQTRLVRTDTWLAGEPPTATTVDALVLRYLRAFGPAAPADVRTWSRLTGLRDVLERLRPRLRTFRDERGRELLDVEDGLLPDPGVPAAPRFLPEFDNVALSHDDRSRILDGSGPGLPFPRGTWIGTLLADGFYRANWSAVVRDDVATLTVDRFAPRADDPPQTRDAIEAEGLGLLALIAPERPGRVAFAG